jgi:hypothetical protein
MKINKDEKVKDIQTRFSAKYPKLKLAFYTKEHAEFHGSKKTDEVNSEMALAELNPNVSSGEINIDETRMVKEVESDFEDYFGLHVQVFRKSNNIWLQTSVTDDWTLAEQESKGEHSEQED